MRHPVETVHLAGAAIIENSNERDPDKWRVTVAPSRIVNRHGGRSMMLFLDGHASSMKAREVGFQYPKGHPLAMWNRDGMRVAGSFLALGPAE